MGLIHREMRLSYPSPGTLRSPPLVCLDICIRHQMIDRFLWGHAITMQVLAILWGPGRRAWSGFSDMSLGMVALT